LLCGFEINATITAAQALTDFTLKLIFMIIFLST